MSKAIVSRVCRRSPWLRFLVYLVRRGLGLRAPGPGGGGKRP